MDIRTIRRRCLFPLIAHSIGLWACLESFFMYVSCRHIYWCAKFSRIKPSMCLYVRVLFHASVYNINTVLFIAQVWVYTYSTCVCIYMNTCVTLCMYVCVFSACTYAHISIHLYQFTNIHIHMISFLLVPIIYMYMYTYTNFTTNIDICVMLQTRSSG